MRMNCLRWNSLVLVVSLFSATHFSVPGTIAPVSAAPVSKPAAPPSKAAAPPSKPAAAAAKNSAPASADYLNELGPTLAVQWRSSLRPIKVWFEPADKVKSFDPEFVSTVKAAFDDWAKASGEKLSFEFVDDQAKANLKIRFQWEHPGPDQDCLGLTWVTPEQDGFVDTASITFFTSDNHNQPINNTMMRFIALHEIGHAIGLCGHSKSSQDIMISYGRVKEGTQCSLSTRDCKTVWRLYNHDPFAKTRLAMLTKAGLTPGGVGTVRLNNEGVYATLKHQYGAAITKLNEALKADPKYTLAMENMSVAYYNWAVEEYESYKFGRAMQHAWQAVEWGKKANNKDQVRMAMQAYTMAKEQRAINGDDAGNDVKPESENSVASTIESQTGNADKFDKESILKIETESAALREATRLVNANKIHEAIGTISSILQKDPTNKDAKKILSLAYWHLATKEYDLHKYKEAEALYSKTLALYEEAWGPTSIYIGDLLPALIECQNEIGKTDEAKRNEERLLTLRRSKQR